MNKNLYKSESDFYVGTGYFFELLIAIDSLSIIQLTLAAEGLLPRQSNVINSHDHLHSLRGQLDRTGADQQGL